MESVEWGKPIDFDGGHKPEYLSAGDYISYCQQDDKSDWTGAVGSEWWTKWNVHSWSTIKAIRLKSDHLHYRKDEAAQAAIALVERMLVTQPLDSVGYSHGHRVYACEADYDEARRIAKCRETGGSRPPSRHRTREGREGVTPTDILTFRTIPATDRYNGLTAVSLGGDREIVVMGVSEYAKGVVVRALEAANEKR